MAKWALVTGVSPGGMGEAEVAAFRKRGVNVVATTIIDSSDKVDYLEPRKGSDDGFLVTLQMDVTSSESIQAAVKQVTQLTEGKLEFLVNNAGFGYTTAVLDIDIAQAKKQYDVNFWGVLAVTQAFFPLLRAAQGTVVNQGSIAGLQDYSRPFAATYNSSKAATRSLSASMRVEFAPFHVKVVTLITGAVKTEFYANRKGGGIPQSSSYAPIKDELEKWMGTSLAGTLGHDRFRVAQETIDEVMKEEPPILVRKGYGAVFFDWLMWLLPISMTDARSFSQSPLPRLKQLLDADGASKKID